MKSCRIGILGATGAVGQEMRRILEEYRLPVTELRLLASARSAGARLPFGGRELPVQETTEAAFAGLDYVLGAVEAEQSRRWAPAIRRSGAVYIDNSSAFRLEPAVPLVVPEINGADAFAHSGIIANPNCSTVISLMAAAPIHRLSPIESMTVSTYQAVSGAGQAGLRELEEQLRAVAAGEEPEAAERGAADPARASAAGELHLCAGAGAALPLHFPLPAHPGAGAPGGGPGGAAVLPRPPAGGGSGGAGLSHAPGQL